MHLTSQRILKQAIIITFNFQYEDSTEDVNSLISVNGLESEKVSTLDDQKNILLQSDYTLPIGEMSKIELGYRGDFSTRSTDFEVSFLEPASGDFLINNNLTNLFNFKQYITALYTQFGSKVGKFSYLLGLRFENTRITLDQPTTGDFNRKKNQWIISHCEFKL
ncbi:MAG: TonB-dependent receptor [Algibacter sp.]|uniref:outer membrane beta-barrel protein n=1 Tax=Algibacter sp. TaxID=1872428 RepID=UPI002623144E|nr:outer membrane beta-barrel protein [Algibacter sp.]MDG1728715.1 TonB-dependent receptor [Algibacter sp.]MDG2178774.1 TonB-dependent receptor [Algibacter sp.]